MLEVIWKETLGIYSFVFFSDTFYSKIWLLRIQFFKMKFKMSVSRDRCKIWPRCFCTNHIQASWHGVADLALFRMFLLSYSEKFFLSPLGFGISIWFTDFPHVSRCFKIYHVSMIDQRDDQDLTLRPRLINLVLPSLRF